MKKTVAEIMRDVLIEGGYEQVGYGDCGLLDECARRSVHTNLRSLHPLTRHKRILDACAKSPLYNAFLFRCWLGNREGLARYVQLIDTLPDTNAPVNV